MTKLDDGGLEWSGVGADGRREPWRRPARCERGKEWLGANLRNSNDLAPTKNSACKKPPCTAWSVVR